MSGPPKKYCIFGCDALVAHGVPQHRFPNPEKRIGDKHTETDPKKIYANKRLFSTIGSWHPSLPLLAIGSYNQEKGGFVTIFQENGQALEGCDWPTLLSNQVTALAWHPTRKLLVVGWDGGELYIWLEYSWARLEAPHSTALTSINFSSGGGRLIASDAAGSLSGWQSSSGAPLTAFHQQLSDVITHIKFCSPHTSSESSIRGLARAAVAGDENALDALAAWRPRTTARIREGLQPDNHACYAAQDSGIILYIDHAGDGNEVQIWMSNKESEIKFSLVRTFIWKTDVLILYHDILVGIVNPHVECYNLLGNKLGILPSSEGEVAYNLSDFVFCSLHTPYVVILTQQSIKQVLMQGFDDENNQDPSKCKQVLNFLYYMTTGNLEKAVVVGSKITSAGKSTLIWEKLAKVCVSRKRADVGAICLSKMGNIKGALMLRQAMNDDSMDDTCKVAVLAVNLGMLGEAEQLFKESHRPDLITRLKSAKEGGLTEIINGDNDGENVLLIKSAQHKLAKVLWANGETGAALKLFESAGTLVPHLPRMLIAQGQAPVLEQYVTNSNDSKLIVWWGHYLESRIEEAEKLCQKNSSSMYQMARYLEMNNKEPDAAVKMYIKCGAISSAIRVAAEASAWNLVWRAGSASSRHSVYAASILENAGQNEQAIALYQKAGKPHMALKLALSCGDTNSLITAVETLGDRIDPELAHTLAEHLRKTNHHSHAAALLATAGKYEDALDIVEESAAPLSEELSERLAAPAGTEGRVALLRRLADVLGARGLYHQAAKRLAHAGDKAGAMRWLLRSGDADRVAMFGAASRDRVAQLMAADFLRRRAAWRTRPDLARHILHFYTRAKAYAKLAAFYAECAHAEVEDYDNYEKALEALKEATRCIAKSSDLEIGSQTIALQEQSSFLKRFVEVKKLLEAGDINAGVASGQQLIHAISGRPGLLSEEKILKLLIQYAPDHHDADRLQQRLNTLQQKPQQESQSTDSPEESIEEVI
ncbi:unnamed protein product, partial [Iphiclides podalirius]